VNVERNFELDGLPLSAIERDARIWRSDHSQPIAWFEVLFGGGTAGATEISRAEFEQLRCAS
jgi:hypothetical protein